MSILDLPDIAESINSRPPKTVHTYPGDPAYRLSGMSPPQVGDIARCGWRKKAGGRTYQSRTSVTCVVCRDLNNSL